MNTTQTTGERVQNVSVINISPTHHQSSPVQSVNATNSTMQTTNEGNEQNNTTNTSVNNSETNNGTNTQHRRIFRIFNGRNNEDAHTEQSNLETLRRKTIKVSVILALLLLFTHFLYLFLPDKITQSTSPGLVPMILLFWSPYCGYEGARTLNPTMVRFFAYCNMWSSILLLLTIIFSIPEIVEEAKSGEGISSEMVKQLVVVYLTVGTLLATLLSGLTYGFKLNQVLLELHLTYHASTITERTIPQPGSSTITLVDYINALANGQSANSVRSNGLPINIVDSLPTKHLEQNDIADEENICVICQEDFESGEEVKTLPCNHQYHENCIGRWFQRSTTCPMCNYDLLNNSYTRSEETNQNSGDQNSSAALSGVNIIVLQ